MAALRRPAAIPLEERSDDVREAVEHGLRLLSRRPRTAHDLEERLRERFTPTAVAAALARLRELRYVDDEAWAAGYLARPRSAARSARLLRTELRAQGVPPEVAAAALAAHDDEAAAIVAVRSALRRLARGDRATDAPPLRRRLRGALARRGFDAETIERALARLRAGARSGA